MLDFVRELIKGHEELAGRIGMAIYYWSVGFVYVYFYWIRPARRVRRRIEGMARVDRLAGAMAAYLLKGGKPPVATKAPEPLTATENVA